MNWNEAKKVINTDPEVMKALEENASEYLTIAFELEEAFNEPTTNT